MKFSSLFFCISSLLIFGCNDSESMHDSNKKEGVSIRITKAMGEMSNDTIQYLPLIGSLGKRKTKDPNDTQFLVLGKDIKAGDNISVKHLSTLIYQYKGIVEEIALAVPLNERNQCFKVESFEQFATEYGSVKFALENWYNHFGGLGNSKFIRWDHVSK